MKMTICHSSSCHSCGAGIQNLRYWIPGQARKDAEELKVIFEMNLKVKRGWKIEKIIRIYFSIQLFLFSVEPDAL